MVINTIMKPSFLSHRAPVLLAIAAGLLSSCQTPDSKTADAKKNESKVAKDSSLYPEPDPASVTEEARKVNDAARLFAGLSAQPGHDIFAKWRSQDFWLTYKTSSDAMWKEFAAKRGKAVRQWSFAEASDLHDAQVVFQPFQGPNFVFSHLMMPASSSYVVCGSVPCVDLPNVEKMELAQMADTIHALRGEMAASLQTDPAASAPASNVPGAVPLLLAFAARTGHVIDGLEILPAEPDAEKKNKNQPDSACVVMMHDAEGRHKKLFYFQQDMSDQSLTAESAVLKFLEQQGKTVAVLRDTRHEMHTPGFNLLREHLMKRGVAFVQDPSGVPFRSFDLAKWNVSLYGTYTGAPGDAREHEQPDLLAAYGAPDAGVGKLPFSAGSLSQEQPAALLVARTAMEPVIDINVTPLIETTPPPTADTPASTTASAPAPMPTPTPTTSPVPATTAAATPMPQPAGVGPIPVGEINLGTPPGAPIQVTALEELPKEIKP